MQFISLLGQYFKVEFRFLENKNKNLWGIIINYNYLYASSGIQIYNSSLKILEKWSVPCMVPESI